MNDTNKAPVYPGRLSVATGTEGAWIKAS